MQTTLSEPTVSKAGAMAIATAAASAVAASSGPSAEPLTSLSLSEAAAKIRSGEVTSTQLTEACLARIAIYDPKLATFITVMKAQALAQAKQLDAEQKAGKLRGPLHGIPIALKDNIDTAGILTTAGSAVFEDRVPDEDAPVTTRLMAAGAVIIGKANLHEFAMGAGEGSFYGPARNPWNLAHNTGGSSSGSGAAVSAELCYCALGTDTAGSIRHPASFCGTVGIKPTFGLVPIRGIAPLTLCLDHCGPLTRTVEDAALVLNTLAGYDRLDITSARHPKEDYVVAMKQSVKRFKLGLPVGPFDHLHTDVESACREAIALLEKMTAGTMDVSLPSTRNLTIATLGYAGETYAYHEDYFKRVPTKYLLSSQRRLRAAVTADANAVDYIRTKWELDLLRRKIDGHFNGADLLVMPTMRTLAPVLNDMFKRNRDAAASNTAAPPPALVPGAGFSNCAPYNAYGLPSITVPCGFSKDGLPIGLMIVGQRFAEGKVFALAHAFEQATEWHKRRPPITPDTAVPEVII